MFVASSFSSLSNYQRENISNESILKRYALLYDNILFNRYGCPIGDNGLAKNLPEFISLLVCREGNLEERKQLAKNKEFSKLFIDCWDIVENPEKFNREVFSSIDEETQNRLGTFSFDETRRVNNLSEDSYAFNIDDVKEINGDLFNDIGLNNALIEHGVDIVPSYSPIIGRALQSEYEHKNIECHSLFQSDILIPNFDSFSWDEIIELRNDDYLKAFRKVIFDIASTSQEIELSLIAKVQSDMWNLITEIKPNTTQTFLTGFIGNLPSPTVVNPIGIASAIKDTYKAHKLESIYGHVFFINNMRAKET